VADEYKGDFARAYFYMVTCYRNKSFTSSGGNKVFTYSGGVAGLTPYAIALFIKWHRQDPVSQKEIDRNEAIYAYQNNRNPYIDHPCLAEYIWGNKAGQTVSLATLDSCNCTDCGQGGGGGNPPVEWGLESVTDIHNTSAILHWTDAHVASYMVDVFTVSTSGYEEDIVLHDLHGANTTSRSGYTEVVKVNADSAIRLGSGSNRGAITYAGLDFSLGGRVVVRASQYSSDTGAPFYIMVGNDSAHYAAAATPGDYQLSVDTMSGQQTLTISTLEKGKRIYVYEVTVITGGEQSDTLHITGYPQNVGNVLQHQVTGLDSNTIYIYRVTPDGMQGAEGVFQTENGWTGWDFVPFPDLEYRLTDRGVMLMGVPREAIVTVFDAMGRMVYTTTGAANPLLLDLPEGLSLIRVVHEGKSQLIKLTN